MKPVLLAIFLTGALMAQTPTKTAPGAAPAKAPPAAKAPAADLMNPASLNRTAPATFRAKLTTTKGDIVIDVTRDWAPHGADRFYNLVRAGFYTDCAFYRNIAGFMVQFGISARPEVTKVWSSARIPDDPVKKSNTRGMVTFATAGPGTRTSQLFINFANNANLDTNAGVFAPFGEVVEGGMSVADMLYNGYGGAPADQFQQIEEQGKPFLDRNFPKLDRILTATIVPAAPATPPAAAATKK
jgi:peptidyl-prolyl cis-trans isomerase A (cyclophilin A)